MMIILSQSALVHTFRNTQVSTEAAKQVLSLKKIPPACSMHSGTDSVL